MTATLDPARQALLDETRHLVGELAARLSNLGVPDATRKALSDTLDQLARPFLLVVVGEFNAGKSAFINALLGARVLEEGVTPTTSRVGILQHGAELAHSTRADGISETTAPAEILRALSIVDTPGTNAVLREHEALTRDFLPRSDLVLFITSADRPYTESERAFLEAIRQWGKKIVIVLNKADLLKTKENQAKVVAFVREHAGKTLGVVPEVVAVSALEALEARVAGGAAELVRDFAFRLSDVEKVLLDFERRGNAFFDERLRLGRFRELFDRDRLRRDFEAEAVAALPYEVERRVDGVVDFLVEGELRQWQDVMALLAERKTARPSSAGRVDDRFAYDRSRLLESVRDAAHAAVEHYDAPGEARQLAEKVRESVAQTALLQVSALGLGTIVAALASTTAADVTGILAAGALSLIGLFLLPARREKARRELSAKVAAVRQKLMTSLTASFETERERAAARVREAVAPYADFVRSEKQHLEQAKQALAALGTRLEDLAARASASS